MNEFVKNAVAAFRARRVYRFQTLGYMRFENPSPAMTAWLNADSRWHEAFDLTCADSGVYCAQDADYAVQNAVQHNYL